jgi:hypothetical protein
MFEIYSFVSTPLTGVTSQKTVTFSNSHENLKSEVMADTSSHKFN